MRRFCAQMRLPHVNSFFWIGLILIGIAVYSVVKRSTFQFDAGVPNEPYEGLIYFVVGVMMIVNGLVHPAPLVDEKQKSKPVAAKPSAPSPNGATVRSNAAKHDDGADSGTVQNV